MNEKTEFLTKNKKKNISESRKKASGKKKACSTNNRKRKWSEKFTRTPRLLPRPTLTKQKKNNEKKES